MRWGFPVNEWHAWFAWRPVCTIDDGWVWLERVERCFTYVTAPRCPLYRLPTKEAPSP